MVMISLGKQKVEIIDWIFQNKILKVSELGLYILLCQKKKIMNIVVISQRDDEYCYEIAAKLYNKYGDDIFSNMFSE